MNKKPEDYLKEPYSRVLLPEEDGRFSGEILEFPGCFAQGDDPTETFKNLEAAARSWIIASLDQGLEIPPPALNQGYSGKIALRIPRSLHKKAAQYAERDATSLNQFFITAIASRIGAAEYHSYLFDKIDKLVTCALTNTLSLQKLIQHNQVTINLPNLSISKEAKNMGIISCLQETNMEVMSHAGSA